MLGDRFCKSFLSILSENDNKANLNHFCTFPYYEGEAAQEKYTQN